MEECQAIEATKPQRGITMTRNLTCVLQDLTLLGVIPFLNRRELWGRHLILRDEGIPFLDCHLAGQVRPGPPTPGRLGSRRGQDSRAWQNGHSEGTIQARDRGRPRRGIAPHDRLGGIGIQTEIPHARARDRLTGSLIKYLASNGNALRQLDVDRHRADTGCVGLRERNAEVTSGVGRMCGNKIGGRFGAAQQLIASLSIGMRRGHDFPTIRSDANHHAGQWLAAHLVRDRATDRSRGRRQIAEASSVDLVRRNVDHLLPRNSSLRATWYRGREWMSLDLVRPHDHIARPGYDLEIGGRDTRSFDVQGDVALPAQAGHAKTAVWPGGYSPSLAGQRPAPAFLSSRKGVRLAQLRQCCLELFARV